MTWTLHCRNSQYDIFDHNAVKLWFFFLNGCENSPISGFLGLPAVLKLTVGQSDFNLEQFASFNTFRSISWLTCIFFIFSLQLKMKILFYSFWAFVHQSIGGRHNGSRWIELSKFHCILIFKFESSNHFTFSIWPMPLQGLLGNEILVFKL